MEEWRNIEGYPGYQVSNLGRVRTHNKVTQSRKAPHREWKDRIMKQKLNMRDGYYRLELWSGGGKHKTLLVHRLVAEAFIPHPGVDTTTGRNTPEMMTVNHINRNKQDNRVENLEWLSLKDNIRAAFAMGLGTEKPCRIKAENGEIIAFKSRAEACRFLGKNHGYIATKTNRHNSNVYDKQGNAYVLITDEEGA